MKYENRNNPGREDMFFAGKGDRTHATGIWKGRCWGSKSTKRSWEMRTERLG